jgi:hypothetical protein
MNGRWCLQTTATPASKAQPLHVLIPRAAARVQPEDGADGYAAAEGSG